MLSVQHLHKLCHRASAGIVDILQTLMGTKLKLSDLHTSVVIPSYELESSSPFTFWHKHSSSVKESQTGYVAMLRADDVTGLDATRIVGGVQFVKGRDFKLWEVARASSAAPTYFPGKLGSSAEHDWAGIRQKGVSMWEVGLAKGGQHVGSGTGSPNMFKLWQVASILLYRRCAITASACCSSLTPAPGSVLGRATLLMSVMVCGLCA